MMAGAPGFEPGIVGTKNRCLTTWLRPNSRNMPAARGLIGRADGKLNAENGRHAENEKCAELVHRFPQIGVASHRLLSGDGIYSPQPAISSPAGSKKWNRLPPAPAFRVLRSVTWRYHSSSFVLFNWPPSRKSFCHRFLLIDCRSRLACRRLAFRTAASYRSCRDTAELRLRQSFQSPATGEQA
jgi:hypothetical protein